MGADGSSIAELPYTVPHVLKYALAISRIFTACSELQQVLFLTPPVCGSFLFVYEISPEPLNVSARNSHGRRVWCLARTSLKVKVKGQGHQGQKRHFSTLSVACVWFMFGKTALASTVVIYSGFTKGPGCWDKFRTPYGCVPGQSTAICASTKFTVTFIRLCHL